MTSYQVYETVYRPINLAGEDELPTMTLQSIIDRDLLRRIERSSRYGLALTVASSFVQLLDSPWLTTTLSKTDIVFVDETPEADLLRRKLPVTRPYLQLPSKADVGSTPSHSSNNTKLPQTAQAISYIQDDPLTQLAIIIFELCFGQALRDHPLRRDYDARAPPSHEIHSRLYDLHALDKLIEQYGPFEKEAGVLEAKAVRWCLWGRKAIPQEQWRTGRWRAEMWINVVEPLKQCCNWMSFGNANEPAGTAETVMGSAPMEMVTNTCVHGNTSMSGSLGSYTPAQIADERLAASFPVRQHDWVDPYQG